MVDSGTGRKRDGFSLLELMVTVVIMATLLTSVFVVLRTSQDAWEGIDSDQTRLESAHATLRHIVRQVRQGDSVLSISAAGDNSGSLSVLMPNGSTYVWDHSGSQVLFGVGTATDLLGEDIAELNFVGYEADASTATTTVGDIQSVLATVQVNLNRTSGSQQTIQSWIWIRTW